jgi:AcrR family transcriptional regulator
VRSSLLEAASTLFAERGPRNVSVRQIAETAGVNHGLVHYYFGSKDGLLTAVLDQCAAAVADEVVDVGVEDPSRLYGVGGAAERHGRILAHVILDARDPRDVQSDFPTLRVLIERLEQRGLDPVLARQRAAQVTALVLGWQLFHPFLVAAAQLEDGATEHENDALWSAVATLLDRA